MPLRAAAGAASTPVKLQSVAYSDCGTGCQREDPSAHKCKDAAIVYTDAAGASHTSTKIMDNSGAAMLIEQLEVTCAGSSAKLRLAPKLKCDMATLGASLGTVKSACWPSGKLGKGCSPSCSKAFVPFWTACGQLLASLGMPGMERYPQLYSQCQAAALPADEKLCGNGCNSTQFACRQAEAKKVCGAMPPRAGSCKVECAVLYTQMYEQCIHSIGSHVSKGALARPAPKPRLGSCNAHS